MDLRTTLRILREHWVLVLVTTIAITSVGVAYALQQTPIYSARVTLFVSALSDDSDTSGAYQGSLLSQQRVKSYTQLIRGERIMKAAIAQVGVEMSPAYLASRIETEVVPETVLLVINVRDPSPRRARDLANAVGEQFVTLHKEFEYVPQGQPVPVRVTIVDRAGLPAAPVSPHPQKHIALAAILGLMAGAGLASARHTLDNSVRTVEQLSEASGAPSLGTVPIDQNAQRIPLVINDGPHTLRAEAFRKIRTSLQFIDLDRSNKVVLVTSAVASEGKSSLACNLAVTVAESGRKVLLVEADLRCPRAAHYLGLPGGIGLTSVLLGTVSLATATQNWGDLCSVLASGPLPPNPSELLGSPQMRQLLAHLRRQYDLIVVDGPPVLPVADAAAMANACDGTILVVRHGKTKREQLTDMVRSLRTVDARILGTVLNMVPIRGTQHYYYYYYGGQERRNSRGGAVVRQQPIADQPDGRQPKRRVAGSTRAKEIAR